ncbi:hypothetical protein Bca52824_056130 [Brassica carinata]|uniref:Uncharacterized protein n=1 Tax=Brassica carinata TaxID=52824 RepID=A0A8X7QNA4_BRACI|nr:hypothetical protein Bca52824_056130 [Brassica carinata]
MSTPHVPSRSFSPSLSMESPEAVSSGFPPLPTKPPDPDLDVMLLVNPHIPPVSPDPPPVLLVCAFLHHISSSFTTPHHRRDPEALMPWFLCASTSFSLKLLCSHAVVITSAQHLGVQFSTAMCSSKSTLILHLKPWLHVVRPIYPCFLLSQEIMLLLNGSLPRSEDVTNPLNFRFKFPLPQYEDAILYRTRLLPHYEAVIWTSVFVAMDSVVSGLFIWRWWFISQQSIFWKRCLGASELVENFLNSKDGMPQEAPHSTLSSELSSLQILSDFIVPFFALCTWLDLIEITGYFVRNLVPLVTPLSCSFNLCTIFVFSCCCLCNGCP